MSKKIQREMHGPGWGEVILGALLSFALGVILAVASLVFTPVEKVNELPKEPVANVVYYIPGSASGARAREAQTKAKAFAQGKSVVLNEDEVNAIVAAFHGQPAKPATPSLPTPPSDKMVEPGSPNFRIRDSALQVGLPLKLSVYGMQHEVIFQARGGFAKKGDTFVFDPSKVYIGSCPIERIPALRDLVFQQLIAAAEIPAEATAAWQKLSDVSVEGANLKLATAAQ